MARRSQHPRHPPPTGAAAAPGAFWPERTCDPVARRHPGQRRHPRVLLAVRHQKRAAELHHGGQRGHPDRRQPGADPLAGVPVQRHRRRPADTVRARGRRPGKWNQHQPIRIQQPRPRAQIDECLARLIRTLRLTLKPPARPTCARRSVPATCPSARAVMVNHGHLRKIKQVGAGHGNRRSGTTCDGRDAEGRGRLHAAGRPRSTR